MPATQAVPFKLTPELRRTSTVVVLGSIMSILDTTIVAVALATLGRDFHVSVTTIQWVATGYLLALALVTPVTGWAVDRFGAKRLWMSSTALFVIGSCLCGLAWSANSLIFFRVLQGIGGGMLLPVGQSILARAAGPQRMGRVMSVIGVPMVLGPIMGPVIGGLIVSNYSWRWIFYINLPIGIVTLILSSRWLPRFDTDERFPSAFDTLGFCLLSPGLAALIYALSEVGTTDSYTSPSVLVSFAIGVVLMAGFIFHAVRVKYPLLDLNPFKHRNFAIANVCIFVIGATLFGSMFLLPIYYQVARGQEAWVAGLLMAPQGIGAACIMRWAGSITDRFGPRRCRAVRHPAHGRRHHPLRLRHRQHQRRPARGHALRARPGARAVDDARHRRGLLRPEPRRNPEGLDRHEHRAPDRRIGGHRPLRRRARTTDHRQPRIRRGEVRGWRRGRRHHGQTAAARGRLRRIGLRPHVLVVGGGHLDRLHPHPLPAQPRGDAVAGARRSCDVRGSRAREGRRRRGRGPGRGRHGSSCGRGDAGLNTDPEPAVPDPVVTLAARLSRAGCVAADEEAAELATRAEGDAPLLEALTERRLSGEPLAWVTGRAQFGELTVRVEPGVYVPRWQSLPLARRATARLPDEGCALDLCTGSGVIAASLSAARPRARVVAIDIDPRAVDCARSNGVEAYRGDLFGAIPPALSGAIDVVVGVVPYVPTPALALLPRDTLRFETKAHYDGGPDGTDVLRRTIAGAPGALRPGGALLLEVGGEQPELLRPVLARYGFSVVEVWADEEGDTRGVEAVLG